MKEFNQIKSYTKLYMVSYSFIFKIYSSVQKCVKNFLNKNLHLRLTQYNEVWISTYKVGVSISLLELTHNDVFIFVMNDKLIIIGSKFNAKKSRISVLLIFGKTILR